MVAIVCLFLLAGCTGAPGTETEMTTEEPEADALPDLPLTIVTSNATAGTPFLVNLTSSLDVNATQNVSWSYTVTTLGNLTENATANVTLEGAGLGLPATLNLTLDAGNFTLNVLASLDGYTDANASTVLEVAAGSVDAAPVDACAGATTQEALTFSGTATGGVLGNPAGPSHSFEVLPCQTKMTVDLSYLESGGDMDVDVFDPSGANVGGGASGAVGSEGPIVIDGPLAAGEWTVEITYFSSGPATYDLTITFG